MNVLVSQVMAPVIAPVLASVMSFPVITPSMTPGYVDVRRLPIPVSQPICIVGDDQRSRHWLRTKATLLKESGFICFVVNVHNAIALARLQRLVPGVSLAPIPGQVFAKDWGIKHYPVIITNKGVGQ